MNIIIANRQRTRKIYARRLRKIAKALLLDLQIEEAELGINLVAAPEMALVNETFLRHEGSTDVITFDYTGPQKERAKGRGPKELYGEIFICTDESVIQSKKFKTAWQSEIVRYLIHGVLHLLGHDDRRDAVRRRMKREENRLLRRLSGKFSLAQITRP